MPNSFHPSSNHRAIDRQRRKNAQLAEEIFGKGRKSNGTTARKSGSGAGLSLSDRISNPNDKVCCLCCVVPRAIANSHESALGIEMRAPLNLLDSDKCQHRSS